MPDQAAGFSAGVTSHRSAIGPSPSSLHDVHVDAPRAGQAVVPGLAAEGGEAGDRAGTVRPSGAVARSWAPLRALDRGRFARLQAEA